MSPKNNSSESYREVRHLQKLITDESTDQAVTQQVGPFIGVPTEPGVDKQIAMTNYERRKLAHNRRRNRQAYDLPEELAQAIARIMDWYRDSKDRRLPFRVKELSFLTKKPQTQFVDSRV